MKGGQPKPQDQPCQPLLCKVIPKAIKLSFVTRFIKVSTDIRNGLTDNLGKRVFLISEALLNPLA
jgi:hypothetical protein